MMVTLEEPENKKKRKPEPLVKYSYSYRYHLSLPGDPPQFYKDAPKMGFQFKLTDPYVRLQMADRGKTEAQRREEAAGRGSGMVGQDKAAPTFRPSEELSKSVDRSNFNHRWIKEMREAVLSAAASIKEQESRERSRAPVAREPSR